MRSPIYKFRLTIVIVVPCQRGCQDLGAVEIKGVATIAIEETKVAASVINSASYTL